jgi:hypothetical protein
MRLAPEGAPTQVVAMDVVDGMDTTSQVNLLSVHIVHKVHAVHHFEKRLQF